MVAPHKNINTPSVALKFFTYVMNVFCSASFAEASDRRGAGGLFADAQPLGVAFQSGIRGQSVGLDVGAADF